MSRYRKVDLRIWGDERVRRLSVPKPNGRDCWLYLLTAKETIILPGAIPAGPGALAESLRWSPTGFRAAFAEVEAEGMAVADWKAGLIWIQKAIHYNPPENPNVAKAWGKSFVLLPDCPLRGRIKRDVEGFLADRKCREPEAFAKAFQEGLANGFGTVSKSGSGAGAGAVLIPMQSIGSGEADRYATEAHWVKVAEQLAGGLSHLRDISGRFEKSRQVDLDNLQLWAEGWCLKYQPDERQLAQMHRAFIGWLEDESISHDLSVWCSESVGIERWYAVRARDGEAPQPARRVS